MVMHLYNYRSIDSGINGCVEHCDEMSFGVE